MNTLLTVGFLVLALTGAPALVDAQSLSIPSGAAVYIENMDPEFEVDFRAELTRQKVALIVISSREEAQILIVGADPETDVNIAPQSGAIVLRVRRGGTVRVQDKATSTTLSGLVHGKCVLTIQKINERQHPIWLES